MGSAIALKLFHEVGKAQLNLIEGTVLSINQAGFYRDIVVPDIFMVGQNMDKYPTSPTL